jgi:hypothetical protein
MPPKLPDRYELNVRLGVDGDIEEWLATDGRLERPVLIRFAGPDCDEERIETFLAPVRAAAATTHPHVQKVFEAAPLASSAYSASEWDGAVTIADRMRAGETIPVLEYLPNAAGLADGLASFHRAGGVHGHIDTSAIHFSAAHPAKLGGFGRTRITTDQRSDTIALAAALRTAITGSENAAVAPSHVVEGLPPDVDRALSDAEAGAIDAATLGATLRAIPYTPPIEVESRWSKRGLFAFAFIVVVAIVVSLFGMAIDFDPSSPFLYPAAPSNREPQAPALTAAPRAATGNQGRVRVTADAYDPFGDGVEEDELAGAAVDGDRATAWRTETYRVPLAETKEGVGLVLAPAAEVSSMEVLGTPGTRYRIGWSESVPTDPSSWANTGSGSLLPAPTLIQLPVREGGVWLLWLTDLPETIEGAHQAEIREVRMHP